MTGAERPYYGYVCVCMRIKAPLSLRIWAGRSVTGPIARRTVRHAGQPVYAKCGGHTGGREAQARAMRPTVLAVDGLVIEAYAAMSHVPRARGGAARGARAPCCVCLRAQNGASIAVCAACARAMHAYCANPPVASPPPGAWLCPVCVRGRAAKRHDARVVDAALRSFPRLCSDQYLKSVASAADVALSSVVAPAGSAGREAGEEETESDDPATVNFPARRSAVASLTESDDDEDDDAQDDDDDEDYEDEHGDEPRTFDLRNANIVVVSARPKRPKPAVKGAGERRPPDGVLQRNVGAAPRAPDPQPVPVQEPAEAPLQSQAPPPSQAPALSHAPDVTEAAISERASTAVPPVETPDASRRSGDRAETATPPRRVAVVDDTSESPLRFQSGLALASKAAAGKRYSADGADAEDDSDDDDSDELFGRPQRPKRASIGAKGGARARKVKRLGRAAKSMQVTTPYNRTSSSPILLNSPAPQTHHPRGVVPKRGRPVSLVNVQGEDGSKNDAKRPRPSLEGDADFSELPPHVSLPSLPPMGASVVSPAAVSSRESVRSPEAVVSSAQTGARPGRAYGQGSIQTSSSAREHVFSNHRAPSILNSPQQLRQGSLPATAPNSTRSQSPILTLNAPPGEREGRLPIHTAHVTMRPHAASGAPSGGSRSASAGPGRNTTVGGESGARPNRPSILPLSMPRPSGRIQASSSSSSDVGANPATAVYRNKSHPPAGISHQLQLRGGVPDSSGSGAAQQPNADSSRAAPHVVAPTMRDRSSTAGSDAPPVGAMGFHGDFSSTYSLPASKQQDLFSPRGPGQPLPLAERQRITSYHGARQQDREREIRSVGVLRPIPSGGEPYNVGHVMLADKALSSSRAGAHDFSNNNLPGTASAAMGSSPHDSYPPQPVRRGRPKGRPRGRPRGTSRQRGSTRQTVHDAALEVSRHIAMRNTTPADPYSRLPTTTSAPPAPVGHGNADNPQPSSWWTHQQPPVQHRTYRSSMSSQQHAPDKAIHGVQSERLLDYNGVGQADQQRGPGRVQAYGYSGRNVVPIIADTDALGERQRPMQGREAIASTVGIGRSRNNHVPRLGTNFVSSGQDFQEQVEFRERQNQLMHDQDAFMAVQRRRSVEDAIARQQVEQSEVPDPRRHSAPGDRGAQGGAMRGGAPGGMRGGAPVGAQSGRPPSADNAIVPTHGVDVYGQTAAYPVAERSSAPDQEWRRGPPVRAPPRSPAPPVSNQNVPPTTYAIGPQHLEYGVEYAGCETALARSRVGSRVEKATSDRMKREMLYEQGRALAVFGSGSAGLPAERHAYPESPLRQSAYGSVYAQAPSTSLRGRPQHSAAGERGGRLPTPYMEHASASRAYQESLEPEGARYRDSWPSAHGLPPRSYTGHQQHEQPTQPPAVVSPAAAAVLRARESGAMRVGASGMPSEAPRYAAPQAYGGHPLSAENTPMARRMKGMPASRSGPSASHVERDLYAPYSTRPYGGPQLPSGRQNLRQPMRVAPQAPYATDSVPQSRRHDEAAWQYRPEPASSSGLPSVASLLHK